MKKYFIGISLSLTMLLQAFAAEQNNTYKIKVVGGKEYYEYPVETSEGFYSVSRKFHITESEIKAANPNSANGLTKGSTLLIPVPSFDVHKVQKEETLYSLKQKYNTSYDELYKLNPTLKEVGLVAGTEIRVPRTNGGAQPLLAQAAPAQPTTTAYEKRTEFSLHEVKAGETLFSISQQYDVTTDEIKKLNPSAKEGIQTGQRLVIPPSHTNTAVAQPTDNNAPKNNAMMKTHRVQKDETLYGICQKYGVSREDVLKINPGADTNLKEGRILTIPTDSKPEEVTKVNIRQMHVVKKKETFASISEMYGLTEDELKKANPAISEVKKGITIAIPEKAEAPAEKVTVYGIHKVLKGETLYAISRLYGIDIDDILRNNSLNNNELIEGQILFIEQQTPTTATPADLQGFQVHTVAPNETVYGISQKYGLAPEHIYRFNPSAKESLAIGKVLFIPDSIHAASPVVKAKDVAPKKELNIALALPFQFAKVTETSVTEKNTKKFLEFYQGMLIAVDSMKKKGVSTNLYVYDSGKSEDDAQKLLNKEEMKKMDFIIGPAYTSQLKAFSLFSEKNNIKLIIPFSSKADETLYNANIFQPNTPKSQHNHLMAKAIINTFKLENIVLVNFKDPAYNNLQQLADTLKAMMKAQGKIYTEVTYSNIESVRSGLNSKSDNAVITLTTNQVALNKILPVLNMMGEKHSVKIVGFPEWQSYQSISKDMFQLETYIPSTFYINFNDEHVRTYLRKFRALYRQEPDNSLSDQTQYGMLGYDLTMYFSEAMSNFGHDFEDNIANIQYKPLQCNFKFKKINETGGYYNHNIYFINHNAQTGLTAVTFE